MTETITKKASKPIKEKKEEAKQQKPTMATLEQLLELQKHFNENYCNSRSK
jgi:hypothetical protein